MQRSLVSLGFEFALYSGVEIMKSSKNKQSSQVMCF